MLSGMVGGAFAGLGQVASGASKFCFVAGTKVLTTSGHKNIEEVKVWDVVPCVNEFTGEYGEKKIIDLSVLETNKFIKVTIAGEEIICTPEHPFQVKSKGFIEAGQLELGDLVYNNDLQTFVVESVEYYESKELVKVYNFTVEDYHTYFVGENCLIVHNVKCGGGRSGKQPRLKEISQDPKTSTTLRNEIIQSKKVSGHYNVPQGYELRHRLGFEASKGYGYKYADLQNKATHAVQTQLQRMMGRFK